MWRMTFARVPTSKPERVDLTCWHPCHAEPQADALQTGRFEDAYVVCRRINETFVFCHLRRTGDEFVTFTPLQIAFLRTKEKINSISGQSVSCAYMSRENWKPSIAGCPVPEYPVRPPDAFAPLCAPPPEQSATPLPTLDKLLEPHLAGCSSAERAAKVRDVVVAHLREDGASATGRAGLVRAMLDASANSDDLLVPMPHEDFLSYVLRLVLYRPAQAKLLLESLPLLGTLLGWSCAR